MYNNRETPRARYEILSYKILRQQALRAIVKFCEQDMRDQVLSNGEVLFNLNAIKYILPHIDHNDLIVKRFALKALAQLCQLSHGPQQVLEDSGNLKKLVYLICKVYLSPLYFSWCLLVSKFVHHMTISINNVVESMISKFTGALEELLRDYRMLYGYSSSSTLTTG